MMIIIEFLHIKSLLLLLLLITFSIQFCIQPCFATAPIQLANNDVDEQRYIDNNRRKAEENAEQAMLKVYQISCLNSDGKKALQACDQALAIDANDTTIKKRKAELVSALAPPPTPKHPPNPVQPVQIVKPVMPKQQESPPDLNLNVWGEQEKKQTKTEIQKVIVNEKEAQEPKQKPKKDTASKQKTVQQVQRKLKQLGFSVGEADGVVGKKTKQAIKRFQKLSKRPVKTNIDRELLTDLKAAYREHKMANKLHTVAIEQQQEGRLERALVTTNKGLKKAPWHQRLKTLRGKIQQQIEVALQETEKEKDKNNKKDAKDTEDVKKYAKKIVLQPQQEPEKETSEKQQKLLESIVTQQKKIEAIDINISMEQLLLLTDAQQSLKKFASE